MKGLRKMLRRFACEESGLESIEYAIIVSLVTVAVIATIVAVGFWVNKRYGRLAAALYSAAPAQ